MAEVLHSRRGAADLSGGVNACGRAVIRSDLYHQRLRNYVLRASYPVFDLSILFRRPGNDDVHAIFQVKDVSAADRG